MGRMAVDMREVRPDQLPVVDSRAAVTEIPAASVILLRGDPLQVLLMRRNDESTFVPGAWIFPGGALDVADRDLAAAFGGSESDLEAHAMKICGMRETLEEAGVWLGAAVDCGSLRSGLLEGSYPLEREHVAGALESLVYTSRWVTPEGLPRRYDTWFFLAEAPVGCEPEVDGAEAVELRWLAPSEALEENRNGHMKLVFPTIRNLEALTRFASPAEAIAARRGADVPIHRPVLVREGKRTRIALPDEP